MAKRIPDVIDVSRYWTAWVGSRRHGYSVGVVQHAERHLALEAARTKWPDKRITFVTEG